MEKPQASTPCQHPVCWKCNGSGKFFSGGAVVNGRYTGHVGVCFACQGKGYQTPSDKARNAAYWSHYHGGF